MILKRLLKETNKLKLIKRHTWAYDLYAIAYKGI